MRILSGPQIRLRDADTIEQFDHERLARGLVLPAVYPQHLGEAVSDALDRVEGVVRILRDPSDARAAHGRESLVAPSGDVDVTQQHLAAGDPAVGGEQTRRSLSSGGLSRS